MKKFDVKDATSNTHNLLANFSIFGIVSRGMFGNTNSELKKKNYPEKILKNYKSVIFFGEERDVKEFESGVSKFIVHFEKMVKPLELVTYLDRHGYRSIIVPNSILNFSLNDICEIKNIKEDCSEKEKVEENSEKRFSIHAIVTEAPLSQSILPKLSSVLSLLRLQYLSKRDSICYEYKSL
ncbi:MAG: hypothetical protein N4A76_07065 [Firmicutes bacterium]|jgi:hypothetical protein|nr:hypothetical protein [Bacillota bacterium]